MSFTSGKMFQRPDGRWVQELAPEDSETIARTAKAIAIFKRFSMGESIPHDKMKAAVRHIVRLHRPVGGAG